jgi:MFS family permease
MYDQTLGREEKQTKLSTVASIALLVIVALSYSTNAMDRSLYPQLLPYINEHYGFSLVEGGLLSTIFALGMGLGGIPAGYLIDRLSRKRVVIIGICIYSLFTLLNAYAYNFWDMAAYRVLTGVGEALQQTALFAMVGAFFYQHRTAAIGSMNVAYGLGTFLGPLLGMQLFLRSGQQWTIPLIVFGVIGLVYCVIIWVGVPEIFSEAKGKTQTTVSEIIEDHLPRRLMTKNLILISIVNVLIGLSNFAYLGLYPTFLKSTLHYDPTTAAFCASMYGIGAFMGLPAGYIGDKLNQKWVVLVSVFGSMCAGFFIFNVATSSAVQATLSFIMGTFGSGFLFVNIYALTQKSVRKEFLGRSSGVASSAHYLPAAFAGMIFGWVTSHWGWGTAAMIVMVLLPLITIPCMLMFDSKMTSKLVPSKQEPSSKARE